LEQELIARAKSGNSNAFDELIKMHQEKVFRLAYRMLDNRDDALDVVQETFSRAYRSLKSFRGESSFKSWVTRIATNLCISRYRRKRIFIDIEEMLGLGKTPHWDMEIDADVHRKALSKAMTTLTSRERAVFVLRMEEELTIEQTAQMLKIAGGTVKALLHRANEKMKKELRKLLPNEEF